LVTRITKATSLSVQQGVGLYDVADVARSCLQRTVCHEPGISIHI
jgi:hypothetical protein